METIRTEHIIDLDLPAKERWKFLLDYREEVNELLECYLSDFEEAGYLFDDINQYKTEVVSAELLEEIEFIASISNFTAQEVLVANLYYDVIKFYFGCTAFAVESDGVILHARNLDWWTDNNILSEYSKIFDFRKNNATVFKTVGWPGFIGALSGVSPQKFSITLNSILSNDPPEIATPITFLLREVLENADSYENAKGILENTGIACDCLLLIAGANKGEMAVIERTPKRYATRLASNHFIAVTNDYKLLENEEFSGSELQSTSCSRFERAVQLIAEDIPKTTADCFNVLKDKDVMMGITVQQMVFDIGRGQIELIRT